MDKVYTKTGDEGLTSLNSGERVEKDSDRVIAYGTIDELDSVLGMARAHCTHVSVAETILAIQKELWLLMADVATLGGEAMITDEHVTRLETIIDEFQELLPPLTRFLIPGDTKSNAFIDLARTTTRRAERALWHLSREEAVHDSNLKYLNRLSDLCFILGRVEAEIEPK